MAATAGPSPSFGTRAVALARTTDELRRRAVLHLCYAARDQEISVIRELLEIVGLDPHEGRIIDHGSTSYSKTTEPTEVTDG